MPAVFPTLFRVARWEPGATIPEAGLKVLEVVKDNNAKAQVLYRVEMLCCGATAVVLGKHIAHRGRTAARKCRECYCIDRAPQKPRKRRARAHETPAEPDHVIVDGPTWPVPPGQPLGPYFWGGDGSIPR